MLPSNPPALRIGVAFFLFGLMASGAAATDRIPLPSGRTVVFLDGDDAKAAITDSETDPFFGLLTQLDMELRLAEPLADVQPANRLEMVKKLFRDAVTDWPEPERRQLAAVCQQLEVAMDRMNPGFLPKDWKFIRTNGTEEAHAAYTRGAAIILPAAKLAGISRPGGDRELAHLVAHESAHVFSRLHPEVREKLYRRLGFQPAGRIELGDWLGERRITNPDGPTFEDIIRIQHPTYGAVDGALVTYSPVPRFSPTTGRSLFQYLRWGIAIVDRTENGYRVRNDANGAAVIVKPDQVTGFYEQIGRNTDYIIHPDEILAENLALLMTRHIPGGGRPIADEALLADLARILTQTPIANGRDP